MLEEKAVEVECDCREETPETLDTFDEKKFLEDTRKRFKMEKDRELLRKKKQELVAQVRKELNMTEDPEDSLFRSRRPKTSEIPEEDYKALVDNIVRLNNRNTQIINTFIDKAAIEKVARQHLSGTMVEEYLNNEETLHTLLDRIQSINISIRHGENFENSKFGPVSKRMSDH